MTNFDEYIRQGEPAPKERAIHWQIAIGLQQVDGLTPSSYLIETARQNIEGDITIAEVKQRLNDYYETQNARQSADDDVSIVGKATDNASESERTEEADKVSARITEILSEKTFSLTPVGYIGIHRRLFTGLYKFAGELRDYNITKAEWVLDGETVYYASADDIAATLKYDFEQEKKFDYKCLTKQQFVEHFAEFISRLWQIHAFGEGNTRTTAVFAIKYLRTFGFNVGNELFAQHSWYFRNALVRANYKNYEKNIRSTNEFLLRFFGNIVLGENNILKNRELHILFNSPSPLKPPAHTAENATDTAPEQPISKQSDTASAQSPVVRKSGQKGWSENLATVFSLIQKNPLISRKELSATLKINPSAIQKHIAKLKSIGAIRRIGARKNGHWEITQK